jgi:hypothetical protein
MNTRMHSQAGKIRRGSSAIRLVTICLAAVLFVSRTGAQDEPKTASSPAANPPAAAGQPNDAEMMKQMMELAKLNENHTLMASLAGTWSFDVTMWMAPGAPPMKSSGIATRKPIMDGRYFVFEVNGKMKMPGPDG